MKFNNFFALVYLLFFMSWCIFLLVAVVNIDLESIVALGLSAVTGVLVSILLLIAQFYYRKNPPKEVK